MTSKALAPIDQLRVQLAQKDTYQQILNYFGGDEEITRKFVSSAVHVCRKVPALLTECDRTSLLESLITCADLKLFPSSASGEAFIIPYKKGKEGGKIAQFQLGYQGLITLGYRSGMKEIVAELVRKNDIFKISRGKITHDVDPLKTRKERGNVIGAYAIIVTPTGGTVESFMRMEDIQEHAKKFSKSYNSEYSPWEPANDPEGWMPRKTVLKQTFKLAPKNETIARALELDNRDSVISDRDERRRIDPKALKEGAPTIRSMTQPHEAEDENQDPEEREGLFGVADNSPRE